ncbi:phosphatidate cytidylyltransferase, mitochondrial-like isoform X3 [Varroa destructor]|uniref:Phosphatidate cytidylyltransferase, mitochondrial n=1 Tax=Varroa destructor TaxID=109461 RepID=A0A7M7KGL9_VARDE|nr:phosphatidate cytidylyltransferase, mitochondrial-like isoform X3 [Varroa destructor]
MKYICSWFVVKFQLNTIEMAGTTAALPKAAVVSSHWTRQLLTNFPPTNMALAYGSAVFRQANNESPDNMLDVILVVDNPKTFHIENLKRNKSHYSLARYLGPRFIAKLTEMPAYVYYNTAVRIEDQLIKYGVISKDRLISDLLDWDVLYVAGRMQKPVKYITPVDAEVLKAQQINLNSAVHAALLTLPETFTLEDLFLRVTRLSYDGDFRMIFGEDRNKISNIVKPAVGDFTKLYAPVLQAMSTIEWTNGANKVQQDLSEQARLHHLELLPKAVQHQLMTKWRPGENRHKDVEDILKSIARNPASLCAEVVQESVRAIVWSSALKQSIKGLVTSGPLKALSYSASKISKMMMSIGIWPTKEPVKHIKPKMTQESKRRGTSQLP